MITNIIDEREFNHKWTELNGVVEPTCHDNNIQGADQAPIENQGRYIESDVPMSLSDLLKWASQFDGHNTLYIS